MSEDSPASSLGQDRFLLAIIVGAVALIVLGIVAVGAAGRTPPPAPADPDSAVGVVQAYVAALRAGDFERAETYLTRSARESLSREPFRERPPRPSQSPNTEQRALIEPVQVGAERAEVRVTISTFTADTEPFSTSTFHREVTVHLIQEAGAWRITQPLEPFLFS